MTKRPLLLTLVAAALFAPSSLAKAPYDQYERFETSSDTIVDAFTHLTWTRAVAKPEVPYGEAEAACVAPYRLPTVKELQTLVDEQPANLSVRRYIDSDAFPPETTPISSPYWSATKTGNGGERYVVNFATGGAEVRAPDKPSFYRCVKGPS